MVKTTLGFSESQWKEWAIVSYRETDLAAERWKWDKEQSYEKPEDVSRKKRVGKQGRAQTKMMEPKTET